MSSLLEKMRLKRKQAEEEAQRLAASGSTTTTATREAPVQIDIAPAPSSSTPATPSKSVDKGEDEWINADRTPQKRVQFFPTDLTRKINPDRLVWASYYAWGGTSVPARLCDNQEALSEPTIQVWPIPANNAVVEILGQVQEGTNARLIIIDRAMMFPYWAKSTSDTLVDSSSEDEEEESEEEKGESNKKSSKKVKPVVDKTRWNEHRMKSLKIKILDNKGTKKYTTANRDLIWEQITTVSNQLLSNALQAVAANIPPPTPSSPKKRSSEEISDEGENLNDAINDEVASPPTDHRPLKPTVALEVGDEVCYFDRMMTDKLRFAKIIKITPEEKSSPLELDNDDVLYSHTQVAVKPKDATAFPLDPVSKRPTIPFFPIQQYMSLYVSSKKAEGTKKATRGRPKK